MILILQSYLTQKFEMSNSSESSLEVSRVEFFLNTVLEKNVNNKKQAKRWRNFDK